MDSDLLGVWFKTGLVWERITSAALDLEQCEQRAQRSTIEEKQLGKKRQYALKTCL